jgi:hypothetical protein
MKRHCKNVDFLKIEKRQFQDIHNNCTVYAETTNATKTALTQTFHPKFQQYCFYYF